MADEDEEGTLGPRIYTVPFDRVWRGASWLLSPEHGWTMVETDPNSGSIMALRRTPLLRREVRVLVTISLDPVGLTRVDAVFLQGKRDRPRRGQRRRVRRFFRRLDRAIVAVTRD